VRTSAAAALCSLVLVSACGDGAGTSAEGPASEPAATATASAATPPAVPASPQAQAYLDAVRERDAVVARLGSVLSDALDLPVFQAAGTEYATAVEAFDRALAATSWPAGAQPLVDQVRAANVAEVKAARLMGTALDETSARLATATLREARRRATARDAALRTHLGLPAAG
jgi:hypothetical protein